MKRLAHYSQYFLRHPRLIKELVGHTSIKQTDTVYDIGAGSGTISAVLAGRCQTVVAIELEPRMAKKLAENMQRHPNVRVYQDDFLSMDLPITPYKIFSNIPFHLSSQIVRKITETEFPPDAAYLIVQKQFANKLLPDSDRFTGQLGMMIGPEFAVRIRRKLLRTDYWPHPNVDTVLLEIAHRPASLVAHNRMPAYRHFIEDCFSDPKIFKKMPQTSVGLTSAIRPSQMKLTDWVALFAAQQRY
jgi:23S rRNA (adenine-N6)-dimethyltransferase